MRGILAVVDWLSGEWMLRHRSNSGSVVFIRALLVSLYVFALGLALKCAVDPDTSSDFSLHQLRVEVRDNLAWLGAAFAAAYTGFYARYASQWGYIAGLYNQIMATASSLQEDQGHNEALLNWQAGFIEDCYYLHLDRKEVFSFVIKQLLDDPAIMKTFMESTPQTVSHAVLQRCGLVAPTT